MKKIALVFICLFVVGSAGFSQSIVIGSAGVGVEYNPISADYLAWTTGLNLTILPGEKHKVFYEFRFGGGAMTYHFEGPNPYTVQHENIQQWEKGSLYLIIHNSAFYQYDLNRIIGLRAGLNISVYISDLFDIDIPAGVGISGRAGISLFPASRFSLAVEANPGWIFAGFRTGGAVSGNTDVTPPLVCPITIIFSYNFRVQKKGA